MARQAKSHHKDRVVFGDWLIDTPETPSFWQMEFSRDPIGGFLLNSIWIYVSIWCLDFVLARELCKCLYGSSSKARHLSVSCHTREGKKILVQNTGKKILEDVQ